MSEQPLKRVIGTAGQVVIDTGITLLGLATAALVISTLVRLVSPEVTAVDAASPRVPPPPGPVRVEVLNGCGVEGAARQVVSLLRSDTPGDLVEGAAASEPALDVLRIGNHDDVSIGRTIVIDRVGDSPRARSVARALGLDDDRIVLQRRAGERVEVTVVVGYDGGRWDEPLGER